MTTISLTWTIPLRDQVIIDKQKPNIYNIVSIIHKNLTVLIVNISVGILILEPLLLITVTS